MNEGQSANKVFVYVQHIQYIQCFEYRLCLGSGFDTSNYSDYLFCRVSNLLKYAL